MKKWYKVRKFRPICDLVKLWDSGENPFVLLERVVNTLKMNKKYKDVKQLVKRFFTCKDDIEMLMIFSYYVQLV